MGWLRGQSFCQSYRGPGFSSQQQDDSLQPPVTPVPRDLIPSADLSGLLYACGAHIYMLRCTHIYIKLFLKRIKLWNSQVSLYINTHPIVSGKWLGLESRNRRQVYVYCERLYQSSQQSCSFTPCILTSTVCLEVLFIWEIHSSVRRAVLFWF